MLHITTPYGRLLCVCTSKRYTCSYLSLQLAGFHLPASPSYSSTAAKKSCLRLHLKRKLKVAAFASQDLPPKFASGSDQHFELFPSFK